MGNSDLLWVVQIPIPSCPQCHKEGMETIARLENRDEIACASCGKVIDLTSEDWRIFLKEAADAIRKLGSAYRKVT
jgi:transcription initiation factor TFIIIB Brf1 subunit/transcription initiation factor TFIIB